MQRCIVHGCDGDAVVQYGGSLLCPTHAVEVDAEFG
ncbi:hypothetical protein FB476_2998 [Ornithinimicrobium humiphilum]|uniref:Uncharacterized protein n=1 Tax=Ornithinimicrobium humiphilum TaxID=125288 RepID=A0A543K865_9MICO|nr:hypothetical protein FB476_2998 [Ornithinimicrobium humiphilum]